MGIGFGLENTIDILSECSETPIAASVAFEYQNDGYIDWYLPSINELNEMNLSIGQIGNNLGGFHQAESVWSDLYWSSTNGMAVSMGAQNSIHFISNSYELRVRPIRSY